MSPSEAVDRLQATPFRGDADVDDLHAFFQPEVHFDGDTLWTFGTSLKSAYVNTFEFMNHAPVVQLWRDGAGAVQAVSRISLGTGEWFHLAAPNHRTDAVVAAMTRQADAAFVLLTDREWWQTVRYESKTEDIGQLERLGYERDQRTEVYMTRSLFEPVTPVPTPVGVEMRLLDPSDVALVHSRAMAQVDAFSSGSPTAAEQAWITRSLPHQMSFGRPADNPSVIAVDASDSVVAFADPFYDRGNGIGEFEPVGTRTSDQRTGLSRAVLARGLAEMRKNGMKTAVVRTGIDNAAAIAAYESAGFRTTDHLVSFRAGAQR